MCSILFSNKNYKKGDIKLINYYNQFRGPDGAKKLDVKIVRVSIELDALISLKILV